MKFMWLEFAHSQINIYASFLIPAGTPLKYANFVSSFPKYQSYEECVMMTRKTSGAADEPSWQETECTIRKNFFCEIGNAILSIYT